MNSALPFAVLIVTFTLVSQVETEVLDVVIIPRLEQNLLQKEKYSSQSHVPLKSLRETLKPKNKNTLSKQDDGRKRKRTLNELVHKSAILQQNLRYHTVYKRGSSGCYTCPPNYAHWDTIGLAYPTNGDQCQCLQNSPAPTNTASSCWTCQPGYQRWYQFGLTFPTNGDSCQCLQASTVTSAPTTTTSAATSVPTTTSTISSADCYTCSPGYAHWDTIGLATPTNGDHCQCLQNSPASTNTASSCWTCQPGYQRWYQFGLSFPTNGDNCQCLQLSSSITNAPSSTIPTTIAPTTTTVMPTTTTSAPTIATIASTTTTALRTTVALTPTTLAPTTTSVAPTITVAPTTTTTIPRTTVSLTTTTPSTTSITIIDQNYGCNEGFNSGGYPCWTCPPNYDHWYSLDIPPAKSNNVYDCCSCSAIPPAPAPSVVQPQSSFLNYFYPTIDSLGCLSFSSDVVDTNNCPLGGENYGSIPSNLMSIVAAKYNLSCVKIYNTDISNIIMAYNLGLKIIVTIPLDSASNGTQKANEFISTFNSSLSPAQQEAVIAVSCGNELSTFFGSSGSNPVAAKPILEKCVSALRDSSIISKSGMKIGVHDVPFVWVDNSQNCNFQTSGYNTLNVDYFGIDLYSFYAAQNNQTCNELPAGNDMVNLLYQEYNKAYSCMQISGYTLPMLVVTETGWPKTYSSVVTNCNQNCPNYLSTCKLSASNCNNFNNNHNNCSQDICQNSIQASYMSNLVTQSFNNPYRIPFIIFEAYDEPIKYVTQNATYEGSWGLCGAYYPYNDCLTICQNQHQCNY